MVINMSENNKKSIEETFSELDHILSKLESNDTSLEESFELYKKGKELIKECDESIAAIEGEVTVLEEN